MADHRDMIQGLSDNALRAAYNDLAARKIAATNTSPEAGWVRGRRAAIERELKARGLA